MGGVRYFKDSVHGYIAIPDELVKCVIETPVFQRLRYIHQNQLGHYVYPHLEHSRFSHSLGVAYLVKEALDRISRNTERFMYRAYCSERDNVVKDPICRGISILVDLC